MYKTITDVDTILSESDNKKVFVLKHSNICGMSSDAKREVDKLLSNNNDIDVYLVIVQNQRNISLELADKLEVKHESPQFLIIKNKKPESVLNHYEIVENNIIEKVG